MKKKITSFIALCLAGAIALTGCSSSSSNSGSEETTTEQAKDEGSKDETKKEEGEEEKDGDIVTIRFGSHAADAMNPYFVDPVTGEEHEDDIHREVARLAMDSVEEKLGVKIEWVQYQGDTTEALLQSVMAGDPVADIVNIYTNGADDILGQNVLQPLDDFADSFEPGTMPAPIYGKHYFVNVSGGKTHPLSPLFYNINLIENVDALKVDGKTVYPTDLYKEGKWTWSEFKKYLQAIDAHYANSQGPVRPEKRVDAFITNYTDTLIQAVHSAGGAVYGAENGVASEPVKKAVAYIGDLMNSGLLKTEMVEEGTNSPAYNAQAVPFGNSETVFTNLEDWRTDYSKVSLAERGESMGFIPFPREDSLAPDSPEYRQVRTGGETWAILKGIPPEKVDLAIKAFQLYNAEKTRHYTEIEGEAKKSISLKIDIFHEKIGQDMQDIYWDSVNKTEVNEQSNIVGTYWPFMTLAGDSILGIDGTPEYPIALESRGHEITDKIKEIETVLASDEVRDNVKPKYTQVEKDKKYMFPKGTDPSTIDWTKEYTVEDNIDGELDATKVVYEIQEEMDFNTPGYYRNGIIGSIKDSSENEGKVGISITIFDAENKTPPTITLKEEYRSIKIDEDTSKINWAGDFVEKAEDKDGLDLKGNVTADLSELNTTAAGEYNVKLSVEDYAGNVAETTLTVKVEEEKKAE